ncbi:peptidyl-prolyl cis-trans isomerase FKBP4 [Caerostris extrusa]|uniref:peptidylprolyl isomerase n=1 Tax=Caerostris extrusa TaxID=172846 RepID=A0AAV4QZZ9_CAEEX|nr:peptidyl-prolyl cis-trans isomerase FKBP4 [Caerostris extrusa]
MEPSKENSISVSEPCVPNNTNEENEIPDDSLTNFHKDIEDVSSSLSESQDVPKDSDIAEKEEAPVLEMIDITPEKSGGVTKQVVKPGEGDELPGFGDRVYVHYTGWLLNKESTMFDSNRKSDRMEFNLGRGLVIKGWDLGVSTMKKGEVALFIIQPQYAYGDLGYPPEIPAHTPLLFEIELYEWKLDDISPKKDGSILRKVIDKGEGTTSPNESSLVKVKLVGYFEDRIFEECEKEFILGECCNAHIIEGIELALFKFHLNEKSLIYLKSKYAFDKGSEEFKIPADATIIYEVTLLSFEKAKEVWEMNSDDKLEKSKISKEKGVAFVKNGNHKAALRQFRWILACLEKEPGVDPETQKDRKELLLSAFLNVSLCLIKMENYVDAIKFCDKALEIEPENEKALYRRGQAKMLFNDCEEALEDFKKLLQLYPENNAARQHISICQEKIKNQNKKDIEVYNKMFELFKKRDEDKMRNMKTETGVWTEKKKVHEEEYKSEAQRIVERNDDILRDANIIELSTQLANFY